ncbi:kallikrein-7-like [Astyanax mexicanus]|uniref:kallikrein-7-like n=1 Tax=Astyanax mexicanus TaxID=7994 RepID=UPI0020CAFD07|nr:kallikrein-7-like [Astyanax mexicanus]
MKMCVVLFTLWAVVSIRSVWGDCKADLKNHHVILTIPGDNVGHCSGVLLSKDWIISAAQCKEKNLEVIIDHSPQKTGDRRKIQKTEIFKNSKGEHDIMLLKIDKEAPATLPRVALPDLKTCKAPANQAAVQFFAWTGASFNFTLNRVVPEKLQCGSVKVADCGSSSRYKDDEEMKVYGHQSLLCTKHPSDACDLFSGAALVSAGKLHGVLVNSDIYCENSLEFINICDGEYRKWILDTTRL